MAKDVLDSEPDALDTLKGDDAETENVKPSELPSVSALKKVATDTEVTKRHPSPEVKERLRKSAQRNTPICPSCLMPARAYKSQGPVTYFKCNGYRGYAGCAHTWSKRSRTTVNPDAGFPS